MKTITRAEKDVIEIFNFENPKTIHPSILEKDILLSEVIQVIIESKHESFDVLFCGGTSLSKGFGIIERMSEDIDFKISFKNEDISTHQKRKLLSLFKKQILINLISIGYSEAQIAVKSKNNNRTIYFDLSYQTQFPTIKSLRNEIKVEIFHKATSFKPIVKPLIGIMDSYFPDQEERLVSLLDYQETVLDKIIAFSRRNAERYSGIKSTSRGYDERQVRHMYDLFKIKELHPAIMDGFSKEDFDRILLHDVERFNLKRDHPDFAENIEWYLSQALDLISQDKDIETHYSLFVSELVFGQIPEYEVVLDNFIEMSRTFIQKDSMPCPSR